MVQAEEQQVQRPWSGAEPHMPEEQRAACPVWLEFQIKGKGGEVAGRREQALGWVPSVFAYVKECLQKRNRETLDGGFPKPTGSSGRAGTDLLVPRCFPSTRNSLSHNGLWIFVEIINNQRVLKIILPDFGQNA